MKMTDLVWPLRYLEVEPFAEYPAIQRDEALATTVREKGKEISGVERSLDLNSKCPVYQDLGYCPYSWRCRFVGGHVRRVQGVEGIEVGQGADAGSEQDPRRAGDWELSCSVDPPEKEEEGWKMGETNWPDSSVIQRLRQEKVCSRPFHCLLPLVKSRKREPCHFHHPLLRYKLHTIHTHSRGCRHRYPCRAT